MEGFGIKENVDILGESFNEVPALRETCAALEDDAIAPAREDTQGFSHVVILLDNGRPQTASLKMLRGTQDRLPKISMFEEVHFGLFSWACQLRACESPDSKPKSKRESGFREARRRARTAALLPIPSARAPSIARTRGGSESATLRRRSKTPFFESIVRVLRTGFTVG